MAMNNKDMNNLRVELGLLFLGGTLTAVAGCAVHHYHHFDQPVAMAPMIAVDSKPSTESATARTSTGAGGDSAQISPHAVATSYESSESGSRSGSPKTSSKIVPVAAKADAPGTSHATHASSESLTTLSFDQVITTTLLADPKIRAGLESIAQANADLRTSSLVPNPSLLTDGIFLPLQHWTPDRPGGPPQTDVQLSYPVDWFLFGKRAAAIVSAQFGVRQSEADYGDLVRQRVRDAAVAFYDVVEAKGLLDLARQDTDNLTKLEAATKKAVDAGGRPIVDLSRVRLDLLKSQQSLREAEAALVVAKAKLRSFLGRADSDPAFDVAGNLDAPITAGPPPVEEAFSLAEENRPDIQSLRWQVTKAQADTLVERRKGYPQVTPMFGYTRQFQTSVLGVPDADSLTVSLTTTLPFFDRNQGNRMKSQSVAVQNSLNLQAGIVDLRAEIEQVVQDFSTAYRNAVAIAQEQLKLAAEVRDSITKAYEVGGRPLIDVLDAQRNYRETYRLYISSRANYWRSLYKFSAAVGKQVVPHDEHAN
jgi:cobalt-zinc-cadmium efflux system outer membrane protein